MTDDDYFEELCRSVFQGGMNEQAVDSRWPGFRRAFSNFSVRAVADYLPDELDRLMSDPEIVRNLRKIEATIENAAEMLLIEIEFGSFANYVESFSSNDDLSVDVSRRFQQLGPAEASSFVERIAGAADELTGLATT